MENARTAGVSVAVLASQTQFAPGGSVGYSAVQSLMVLGCHDGRGSVVINGSTHPLHAGLLYLVPWNHRIDYLADRHSPFLVYGMHIVPWHDPAREIELGVVHGPEDHLYDCRWRQPARPGQKPLDRVVSTTERERPALTALIRYGIEVFDRADPVEHDDAVLLGRLGLREIETPPLRQGVHVSELPFRLRKLATWALDHLAEPITLSTLAQVDGSSPSTIVRLFQLHLSTTPIRWLTQQRIERACVFLASTSLSVSQVASTVGFTDPYYFSRTFKQYLGVAPRAWRSRQVV